MGTIIIPGFKGGIANSLLDPLSKQTYQTAKGLDIFSLPNILRSHYAIDNDITDKTLNNIKLNSYYKGSDGNNYFKGFDEAGGTVLTIWDAGSAGLGSITSLTAETTAAGNVATHGMVEFLANLWYWQTASVLARFDFSTITSNVLTAINSIAPIFVHRGLAKMFYTVSNYQIGGSLTTSPAATVLLTFDNADRVVQMAEYQRWVAVAVNNVNASSSSKIAIWDGSSTTLDDLIDLGDIGIQTMVNVNGVLYVLTSTNPHGWGAKSLIRIYKVVGSRVKLVKELDLQATTTGGVSINTAAVAVLAGKIYFGINASSATTIMTIDNGVYAYDTEQDILTLDRITSDTTAINITSVGFNGGAMVVTWYDGTNYKMSHVNSSPGVSSLGVYQSNAFPLNNGKMGKVKRILILHKNMAASCGFTAKIKHFGHYPTSGSVESADGFANLLTPQGNAATSGFSQSTDDAGYTIIENLHQFKEARFTQLEIAFDEVSGLNSAEILFPIFMDTADGSDRI